MARTAPWTVASRHHAVSTPPGTTIERKTQRVIDGINALSEARRNRQPCLRTAVSHVPGLNRREDGDRSNRRARYPVPSDGALRNRSRFEGSLAQPILAAVTSPHRKARHMLALAPIVDFCALLLYPNGRPHMDGRDTRIGVRIRHGGTASRTVDLVDGDAAMAVCAIRRAVCAEAKRRRPTGRSAR
jgi:hypothetical protein